VDIKALLESTGMKVAEELFFKPPAFPYIVFSQSSSYGGADLFNCISNRSINVELYSDVINRDAEKKIEDSLNEKAIEFKKDRTWIDSQGFFQTVYDFNLLEKI
jgi:hypothetical protein